MEVALQNFIAKLKEHRLIIKMSYYDIVEGTEQIGEPVSLSTVKRIFADGSEKGSFKWKTVMSIGRVLIGEEQMEEFTPKRAAEYYSQSESLLADIAVRQREKEMLEQMLDDERIRNAELKDAAAIQRKQMHFLRAMCLILGVALLSVLLTVLIVDAANPNVGFFFRG